MDDWPVGEVRPLGLEEIGERYRRYRLSDAEAEQAMARSLRRYGQMSPVAVVIDEAGRPELVDGFKRLTACRSLPAHSTLSARRLDGDERSAKAAIYGLNSVGRRTKELEEAWIVQALVREDGLTQVEAGQLLGRHKSWVNRRLALLEKLAEEAKEDLRLGLLSPTTARELVRLPAGNQVEALASSRQHSLGTSELRGVVDLILGSSGRTQVKFVLEQPREALRQAKQLPTMSWDPRLSSAGNRLNRLLSQLLEQLSRMETWLGRRGRAELTLGDRAALRPGLERLAVDARQVGELAEDLAEELGRP